MVPLLRLLTREGPQILLNISVEDLRLTIDLWVIGRTIVQTCATVFKEIPPKVTKKNGISVYYDGHREPVMFVDDISE